MDEPQTRAFGFDGTWRDYAPIAFTNLLLIIVTLGVYRFWATTRTRHYLWSRTIFIDERLEWTGKGLELFIGFLLVVLLLGVPFIGLQFAVQALLIRGHETSGFLVGLVAFGLLFYLGGVARLRALRYRLSRTWWHGIRGGSDERGWSYGVHYCWRTALGMALAYLGTPWAMMSLWNMRWNRMSFGSQRFTANGRWQAIFRRFLLFYLLPILLGLIAIATAGTFGGFLAPGIIVQSSLPPVLRILAYFVIFLGAYALIGIIALTYYAAFLREAIGALKLGELEFAFDATLDDWLGLIFGDVALVVCTLGFGAVFLSYRHWKFFIDHLEASGEVSLSMLTQSTTRELGHGEGLLDAFDIGAI